ncbi:hypothetical protein ABET51_04760, partial [Metabacillus fastidiosus]|uniref:hypothetical protein n=1 Tax=Metabacillus fastidiosus TaxID=1458 RepID=UPI003D289813
KGPIGSTNYQWGMRKTPTDRSFTLYGGDSYIRLESWKVFLGIGVMKKGKEKSKELILAFLH